MEVSDDVLQDLLTGMDAEIDLADFEMWAADYLLTYLLFNYSIY